MSKHVNPEIGLQSFNCPRCGAKAHQTWHSLCSRIMKKNEPKLWSPQRSEEFEKEQKEKGNKIPEDVAEFIQTSSGGNIFLLPLKNGHTPFRVGNLLLSECFSCKELSVWLYDKLLFPPEPDAEEANPDMPTDILLDYNEARVILKNSPRGGAALLRLCIEKLCIHLGAEGKTLDNRIGFLVSNGLDTKIQKALDSVRVIGNEAVHPGQISLNDNKKIAHVLFKLVNQIVHELITKPKELEEIYDLIPDGKKEGIANRDKKKKAS